MGFRWNIRIGAATTPRKQSALRAALAGTMLTRHYQYVQPIYQAALFCRLRDILPRSMSNRDVTEFAEDRINDAFVRVKEYEQLKKAKPSYRFRSFLVKKIIFPAMEEFFRKRRQEAKAIEEYFLGGRTKFGRDYRNEIAKEFCRDALLQLKDIDKVKYEVFMRRSFEQMTFRAIYEELKDQFTLSITSIDATKKVYKRTLPKLKHLFHEIIRGGKYVDRDLPFNKYVLAKLRAETTKK